MTSSCNEEEMILTLGTPGTKLPLQCQSKKYSICSTNTATTINTVQDEDDSRKWLFFDQCCICDVGSEENWVNPIVDDVRQDNEEEYPVRRSHRGNLNKTSTGQLQAEKKRWMQEQSNEDDLKVTASTSPQELLKHVRKEHGINSSNRNENTSCVSFEGKIVPITSEGAATPPKMSSLAKPAQHEKLFVPRTKSSQRRHIDRTRSSIPKKKSEIATRQRPSNSSSGKRRPSRKAKADHQAGPEILSKPSSSSKKKHSNSRSKKSSKTNSLPDDRFPEESSPAKNLRRKESSQQGSFATSSNTARKQRREKTDAPLASSSSYPTQQRYSPSHSKYLSGVRNQESFNHTPRPQSNIPQPQYIHSEFSGLVRLPVRRRKRSDRPPAEIRQEADDTAISTTSTATTTIAKNVSRKRYHSSEQYQRRDHHIIA